MVVKSCLDFGIAGQFGGSGGVANLKTVPVYQGVTDAFLRSSYATDPDGLQLLGDPSSYCVIALCVTE